MLGGGVDAATLVAALGAGPPPPECRRGRRPHRGATACRLLERDDLGNDGPGVTAGATANTTEGNSRASKESDCCVQIQIGTPRYISRICQHTTIGVY